MAETDQWELATKSGNLSSIPHKKEEETDSLELTSVGTL